MKVTLINTLLKMQITLECDGTIKAKNALKHEAVEIASKHTDNTDNHFAYWNKLRDYHDVSEFLDITVVVEQVEQIITSQNIVKINFPIRVLKTSFRVFLNEYSVFLTTFSNGRNSISGIICTYEKGTMYKKYFQY